jgi:hypothetical protein
MPDLATTYAIPPELMEFVNDGFLEVLAEAEAEKTIEFHIPSLLYEDHRGRGTSYSLTWTHPDFNAQFCRYYHERPGDLPNFELTIDTDDVGSEDEDLETVDDLVAWLDEALAVVRRR